MHACDRPAATRLDKEYELMSLLDSGRPLFKQLAYQLEGKLMNQNDADASFKLEDDDTGEVEALADDADGPWEDLSIHQILSSRFGKRPRKVDVPFRTDVCHLGQATVVLPFKGGRSMRMELLCLCKYYRMLLNFFAAPFVC